MDPSRFDQLVAALARPASRRTTVSSLLGGGVAGALGRTAASSSSRGCARAMSASRPMSRVRGIGKVPSGSGAAASAMRASSLARQGIVIQPVFGSYSTIRPHMWWGRKGGFWEPGRGPTPEIQGACSCPWRSRQSHGDLEGVIGGCRALPVLPCHAAAVGVAAAVGAGTGRGAPSVSQVQTVPSPLSAT